MNKVKCETCGNTVCYDYDELDDCLRNLNKCISTSSRKNTMSFLSYFDNVLNCCDEPDYIHV